MTFFDRAITYDDIVRLIKNQIVEWYRYHLVNQDGVAWSLTDSPLESIAGGSLKEIYFVKDLFPFQLDSPDATLPSHLWISTIATEQNQSLGKRDNAVTATENHMHNGHVIWIPTPIGMGAWLSNAAPLENYLAGLFAAQYANQPFRFQAPQQSYLMRVLQSPLEYITITTNSMQKFSSCSLLVPDCLSPNNLCGSAA